MTDFPDLKLKALVSFPAQVVGRTGINVVKDSGTYNIDLDYARFQITPTIPAPDMPNAYNLIWDEVKHTFAKVPFALQATSGVSSIGGVSGAIVIDQSLKLTGPSLGTAGDTVIDDIDIRQFAPQQITVRPVGFQTIDPLASTWRRIATPGVLKPWHKVDASGQCWIISDHVIHPFMFGAKADDNGTSGSDNSNAFLTCFEMMNNFCAVADVTGIPCAGVMVIPPGRYYTAAKISGFAPWAYRNTLISGFGATIRPGDIGIQPVFEFGVAGNGFGVAIEGLTFDLSHPDNRAICAIRLKGTSSTALRKVTVAGGGWAGNQGFEIKQSNENDYTTGSYWVTVEDCFVRNNGPTADMAYGLNSAGSNNALIVRNSKFSVGLTGVGIFIGDNAGTHTGGLNIPVAANSVRILHNAFEGNAYGLHYAIPNGERPFGLVCNGNRFETVNVAHRFTKDGTIVSNSAPPSLLNNTYTGVPVVVDNTAGTAINFYDQRNRTGTATIANGSATVSVAFTSAEYTANFGVSLTGTDGSLYVNNKTATGFDIVRTGTTGALAVTWSLLPGSF